MGANTITAEQFHTFLRCMNIFDSHRIRVQNTFRPNPRDYQKGFSAEKLKKFPDTAKLQELLTNKTQNGNFFVQLGSSYTMEMETLCSFFDHNIKSMETSQFSISEVLASLECSNKQTPYVSLFLQMIADEKITVPEVKDALG